MFSSIYNYFFGEADKNQQYETIFIHDEDDAIITTIEIKDSILNTGSKGCFSNVDIPCGYYVEYEGEFVTEDPNNEYSWPIYSYDEDTYDITSGNIIGYVDGCEIDNWTKHIKYHNDEDIANVGVQQYGDKVFYYIYRDIKADEELVMICTEDYYSHINQKDVAESE